ncbi:PKD domain-containing protein [Nanoarchaeota archaeon]
MKKFLITIVMFFVIIASVSAFDLITGSYDFDEWNNNKNVVPVVSQMNVIEQGSNDYQFVETRLALFENLKTDTMYDVVYSNKTYNTEVDVIYFDSDVEACILDGMNADWTFNDEDGAVCSGYKDEVTTTCNYEDDYNTYFCEYSFDGVVDENGDPVKMSYYYNQDAVKANNLLKNYGWTQNIFYQTYQVDDDTTDLINDASAEIYYIGSDNQRHSETKTGDYQNFVISTDFYYRIIYNADGYQSDEDEIFIDGNITACQTSPCELEKEFNMENVDTNDNRKLKLFTTCYYFNADDKWGCKVEKEHDNMASGRKTIDTYYLDNSNGRIVVKNTMSIVNENNQAPDMSGCDFSRTIDAGEETTFDASCVIDPDGDQLAFYWDYTNDGTVDLIETYTTATTSYTYPGVYTIKLTAVDEHGITASITSTIYVEGDVVNMPADLSACVFDRTINANSDTIFDASCAVDPEGDAMTYYWDYTNDAVVDSVGISATTQYPLGTFTVKLTVIDAGSNQPMSTTGTVISNGEPTAILTGPSTGQTGEEVCFDASQSSDNGQITSVEWYVDDISMAEYASEDTGFCTTFDQDGQYEISITVTDDDQLTNSDTMYITISRGINNGPTFISTPDDLVIAIGEEFRYDADAADIDGDTLYYYIVDAPTSSVTINSFTGMVSWNPSDDYLGDNEITIGVRDGYGGEATQTFTLNVFDPEAEDESIDLVKDDLNAQSIRPVNGDELEAGDVLITLVTLYNYGDISMKNAWITVVIPDLGVMNEEGPFKLKSDRNEQYTITITIPEDAAPGSYPMRISISDKFGLRDIQYRTITIIE